MSVTKLAISPGISNGTHPEPPHPDPEEPGVLPNHCEAELFHPEQSGSGVSEPARRDGSGFEWGVSFWYVLNGWRRGACCDCLGWLGGDDIFDTPRGCWERHKRLASVVAIAPNAGRGLFDIRESVLGSSSFPQESDNDGNGFSLQPFGSLDKCNIF